jgi:hypothetical protein
MIRLCTSEVADPLRDRAVDAIDHTRQYAGEELFPCADGWSWWDFVVEVMGEDEAMIRFNDRIRDRDYSGGMGLCEPVEPGPGEDKGSE